MVTAIVNKTPLATAREDRADRQLVVELGLAWLWLEQVHQHDAGRALHRLEEGERVRHVLDHVEGERQVEARRRRSGVEIVDGGLEAAMLEPPAQVARARIVEVGELDPVAHLEQQQTVAADPAAVVEDARAWLARFP